MDDAELVRELHFLGVDEHTWPVLALLPLIQVAWADGEVQEAERTLIVDVAEREYALDARGKQALANWLAHAPSEQYLRRGRDAARLLAERNPDIVDGATLMETCHAVAKAAGGLFGFRAVDAREQAVLDELSEALTLPVAERWDWAGDLGELDDDDDTDEVLVLEMEEADFGSEHLTAPTIQCTFQPAEAPEEGAPELVRIDSEDVFPLPPGGLSIGRARTSDLWVRDDGKVSRRHCYLLEEGGAAYIEDNDSTTGTFVNGERVLRRPLFGGELVALGDLEFRFVWDR